MDVSFYLIILFNETGSFTEKYYILTIEDVKGWGLNGL